MKKRLLIIFIVEGFLIVVFSSLVSLYEFFHQPLDLIVWNIGNDPLQDFSVFFSGKTYSMGKVEPGTRTSLRLFPRTEHDSSIIFKFFTFDGKPKVIDAGGYFGPMTKSQVEIFMDSKKILSRRIKYGQ